MTEEEIERRLRASLAATNSIAEPCEQKNGIKAAAPSDDEIVKKLAEDMNAGIAESTASTAKSHRKHTGGSERHHSSRVSVKDDRITSKENMMSNGQKASPRKTDGENTAVPVMIETDRREEKTKKNEPVKKSENIQKHEEKNGGKRKSPSALKILRDGIIDNNPVFVQLLGMCSTLATTTSVKNALGMGLATSAVLICSNIMISLLRRIIPKEVRIAAYVVIISGFVTAVELLMRAYLYDLYEALGLFIPLIVVNCIILARAESFASKNGVLVSALDGISTGVGYTLALFLTASVREILGSGSWMGVNILGSGYSPAVIFVLPAGAFLTIGFLLAAVQKIRNSSEDRARKRRLSDISVNTKGLPADEPNE